jgi:endonuclease YncB( thermonuclease family)
MDNIYTDPGSQVQTIDGKQVGSPVRNIDADTISIDNQSYRLQGFNAPETAKDKAGMIIPGQVANDRTQEFVNRAAELTNFTNLKVTGTDPAFPNRKLARQENPFGDSLGDTLVALGITDPNNHTNPEATTERVLNNAVGNLWRDSISGDPIRSLHREVQESGLAAGDRWIPTMQLASPAENAAFQNSIGATAAAKAATEVLRLDKILAEETMSETTRRMLIKQRDEARGQVLFASITPMLFKGTNFQPNDRDSMNRARGYVNQSWAAWDMAANAFVDGVGGMMSIIGDENQWDYLSEKGREWEMSAALRENDLPQFISSTDDIDTRTAWSTVKTTGMWLNNNLITMLPLWGGTLATGGAAALLGASAPVAGAVSVVPGFIMYAGGMYSEQPDDNKNAGQALALGLGASVLDKMGLSGVAGKFLPSILTEQGRKAYIAHIVKEKGVTPEQAADMVTKVSKQELLEVARFSVDIAKKQNATMEMAMRAAARVGAGAGFEGATEMGQSAMEMIGATGQWNLDARYQKGFYDNLVESFVAGGAIGGGLKVPGEIKTAMQFQSALDGQSVTQRELTEAQSVQNDLRNELFNVSSSADTLYGRGRNDKERFNTLDVVDDISSTPVDFGPNAAKTADDLKKITNKEGLMNILTSPFRLFRGHVSQMKADGGGLYRNGKLLKYRAIIDGLFGQSGTIPGLSAVHYKRSLLGKWSTKHTSQEELAAQLGTSKHGAGEAVTLASRYWTKGESLPADFPNRNILENYRAGLVEMRRQMDADMGKDPNDPSASVFDDASMFRPRIEPGTYQKNKALVIQKLRDAGYSRGAATNIANELLFQDKTAAARASDAMMKAGIFTDPDLAHVFEKNFFNTLEDMKERTAAKMMSDKFFGKDGEVLAKLFNLADKNGEFRDQKEKDAFAGNLRDMYDMAHGRYNAMDSYPFLQKVMSWWGSLTVVAVMGKAGLSQLPEVAFSILGTNGEKVNNQLGLWAKNFQAEMGDSIARGERFHTSSLGLSALSKFTRNTYDMRLNAKIAEYEAKIRDAQLRYVKAMKSNDKAAMKKIVEEEGKLNEEIKAMYTEATGRQLYETLGYGETGYNTQSRFEFADMRLKNMMALFAKVTLLKQGTEATRKAALGAAGDTVATYLESIRGIPLDDLMSGNKLTKFQYQALKELQAYGMDVPFVMKYLQYAETDLKDPEVIYGIHVHNNTTGPAGAKDKLTEQFIDELHTTIANFVDSKVPNPQYHNIPKYYHDPRFQFITLMTRYIANLQTTVIPKLYQEYIKDGNLGMRYQAFSVMIGALALSALGNVLKDELAYGEDNPYLNGIMKNTQRTIYGSGLLGKGESVIDAVMPLYERKGSSMIDAFDPSNDRSSIAGYAYGVAKDNMAPISWADRFAKAGSAASKGDTTRATEQLLRTAPLIGSYPKAAKETAHYLNNPEDLFNTLLKD